MKSIAMMEANHKSFPRRDLQDEPAVRLLVLNHRINQPPICGNHLPGNVGEGILVANAEAD
jgi:hypothetical protein